MGAIIRLSAVVGAAIVCVAVALAVCFLIPQAWTSANGPGWKSAESGVMLVVVLGLAFVGYFIPTVNAYKRGHQNRAAIATLNVMLGWTFLGWAIALVWSMTRTETLEV